MPTVQPATVPARAWVVTFAGTSVNLCLGILYAWSVWKDNLVAKKGQVAGAPMSGLNAGWHYLSDPEGTSAYALCGFVFAISMIPGGRIQDRYGPRLGATLGGLFLAGGCILAGLLKSYAGLLLGFGLLGGIGMGLGYSAATPAAIKWFGPRRRGLIVGLVVGGYGAAAIYISPLAKALIANYGLSGSFLGLGVFFAVVASLAASLLAPPPAGYLPPADPVADAAGPGPAPARENWKAPQMLRTWQYYALLLLFIGSAQAGQVVINNAAPMLKSTAGKLPFFVANAWLLASFGGFVNGSGRVGTGLYSDRVGRANAYLLNGALAAICLFLMPRVIASGSVPLLFLAVGVVYWQFGGTMALMPAITADFFGPGNLGFNYGLVYLGWGVAFFIPQVASVLTKETGSLDAAFYMSGGLLLAAMTLIRFVRPPVLAGGRRAHEPEPAAAVAPAL